MAKVPVEFAIVSVASVVITIGATVALVVRRVAG